MAHSKIDNAIIIAKDAEQKMYFGTQRSCIAEGKQSSVYAFENLLNATTKIDLVYKVTKDFQKDKPHIEELKKLDRMMPCL